MTRKKVWCVSTIANLVLLLCAYGMLCIGDYFNGDTLAAIMDPGGQSSGYVGSGRYIPGLICEIAYRMGINLGKTAGVNVFLSLCMLAVSTTIITECCIKIAALKDDADIIKRFICIDSVVLLVFLNLIAIELFCFAPWAWLPGLVSIFLALALKNFADQKYVRAMVFLMAMVMTYQSFIGIFIVFALLFIFVENRGKLNKYSFVKSGLTVAIAGGLCVMDLLSVTLLVKLNLLSEACKQISSFNLMETIKCIFNAQLWVLQGEYGLSIVPYIPFILLLFAGTCILWIYYRKNVSDWLYLVLLIGVSNIGVFAVAFGGYLYMPPRVVVSYWGFICCIVLLALFVLKSLKVKRLLLVAVNLVTLLHIVNLNVIVGDLRTSNALDRYYAKQVQSCIEKYEKESGTEVSGIAICVDEECASYWEEYIKFYNFNINERCVRTDWQFHFLIRDVAGRAYAKIDMPDEIYQEYFAGKDWDYFEAQEQLIFIDNTLYMTVY